jgi:hypothetical protein
MDMEEKGKSSLQSPADESFLAFPFSHTAVFPVRRVLRDEAKKEAASMEPPVKAKL